MELDQIAAQLVMRAHQIERVVNDQGPWSVYVCGQGYFPARKVVGPDHVTFYALVNIEHPGMVELHCWSDTIAVRLFDQPPGEAQIVWEFDMAMAQAA